MDKCPQDKCCLDKCCGDSCNTLDDLINVSKVSIPNLSLLVRCMVHQTNGQIGKSLWWVGGWRFQRLYREVPEIIWWIILLYGLYGGLYGDVAQRPIEIWPNVPPFFGAVAPCTMKNDNFKDDLKNKVFFTLIFF